MPSDEISYKVVTDRKLKELPRLPSYESVIRDHASGLKSNYELRTLGDSTSDGDKLKISEEQRADHMHIIGTTRRGKSKFIEYLIREDIDRGNGTCLLDPSEGGDTAYKILNYCIQKGHTKVCLIDPHLAHRSEYGKVACIQPFHYEHDLPAYKAASVANIEETVKVLFSAREYTETPVIQKYLPAVLNVLYNAKMTLHEAIYFTEYGSRYRQRREEILEHSHPFDRNRISIEESFSSYYRFKEEIGSTARRLEPFFDSTIDLMFGADKGIDFQKMIKEGWVILVNLYAGFGIKPVQTKLLGTAVINELLYAMDKMIDNGWKGVYYLYVDEAGRYANRNLADLLSYKGKTGLRIILSHQYFRQFEDPYILDAVKQQPKIKVMFDTPNYHDRMEMIKLLGYGGDIAHEAAAYANKGIPKQEMIITVGNDSPRRIKVPDVPDIEIDRTKKEEFIKSLLAQEWCAAPTEIRRQMHARFKHEPIQSQQAGDNRSPQAKRQAHDKTDHQTVKGKSAFSRSKSSGNK